MEATKIAHADRTTAIIGDSDVNSTGHCLLLELPPELRNRIYEYVLGRPERMRIDYRRDYFTSAAKVRFPPLLRTCHQIRGEASGIWYSSTTFVWFHPSSLPDFAGVVGDKNFQTITLLLNETPWLSVEYAESSNFRAQERLRKHGVVARSGVITSRYYTDRVNYEQTSQAVERKRNLRR